MLSTISSFILRLHQASVHASCSIPFLPTGYAHYHKFYAGFPTQIRVFTEADRFSPLTSPHHSLSDLPLLLPPPSPSLSRTPSRRPCPLFSCPLLSVLSPSRLPCSSFRPLSFKCRLARFSVRSFTTVQLYPWAPLPPYPTQAVGYNCC